METLLDADKDLELTQEELINLAHDIPIQSLNLRKAREKKGLTMYAAAKLVGVKPNNYAKIEKGESKPRNLTKRAIMSGLRLDDNFEPIDPSFPVAPGATLHAGDLVAIDDKGQVTLALPLGLKPEIENISIKIFDGPTISPEKSSEFNVIDEFGDDSDEAFPEIWPVDHLTDDSTSSEFIIAQALGVKRYRAGIELIKEQRDRLNRLIKRGEARIDWKLNQIQAYLHEGVKIKDPIKGLSIYRKATPKVVIIDKEALPFGYFEEKITRTPNLTAIREAIESGIELPAKLEYSIVVK